MAVINAKMQQRRDTAANWSSNNPTLAAGEIGVETDTNKFKFGDGITAWNVLAYAAETQNVAIESLDDISDVDIAAVQAASDGRALIYQNGKWVAGPVIGGIDYVASGDPYFQSNVSLLVHGDGTPGGSVVTDSSPNGFAITQAAGTVTTSDTQAKFGTALYFDGSSHLSIAANNAFKIGQAYTLEFWYYPLVSNKTQRLVSIHSSSNANDTLYVQISSINWLDAYVYTSQPLDTYNAIINAPGSYAASAWRHVALQRDATGVTTLYVNGTSVGSVSKGTGGTFWPTAPAVYIGASSAGGERFTGYIDDIRLTVGVARYSGNFTPHTLPHPDGAQVTIPFSIDNLDDVDTSTTAPTDGQALTWDGTNWVPATVQATVNSIDDIADVNLAANQSPSDGRVLMYQQGQWVAGPVTANLSYVNNDSYFSNVSLLLHMNGSNTSTTFTDSSNSARTITASNTQVSTAQSKFGGASALVGSADNSHLRFSPITLSSDFTIEFWLYVPASMSTNATVCSADDGNTYFFRFTSGSFILYKSQTIYTGTQPASNQWHHFAWTRSGSTNRVFINGQLHGNTFTWPDSFNLKYIGGRGWLTADTTIYPLNTYIDEFRVTTGVARYTSNFSIPTTAFPDNTQLTTIVDNSINLLSDVDTATTAPASGQTLTWNGTNWVPATVATAAQGAKADSALQSTSSINALADVDTASASPTNGQALVWDAATSNWKPGTVSSGSGGGGSLATQVLQHTTASLASDATEDFSIAIGDAAHLLAVTASHPAWIRVYGTAAARDADTRTSPGGTPPGAGNDFYAELATVATPQTIRFSPVPLVQGTSGNAFIRVKNMDTVSREIAMNFSVLTLSGAAE